MAYSCGAFFFQHTPFSERMAVVSRPDSKAVAPRLHRSRALRKRGRQAKSKAHCSGRSGRRLASGGRTMAGFSARRSLSSSAAPSTLAALAGGKDRRLAATALAAARDRSAAPARSRDGAERARLRAVRFVTMSSNALRMPRKAQKLRARHMLGHPNSSCVGNTLKAREECGPACDSSSARDAGDE